MVRPSVETADAENKDAKNDDNGEKSLEEVIYGESEELVITDIRNQPESLAASQGVLQMISRQVRFS